MSDKIRSYRRADLITRIVEVMPNLKVDRIRRITQGQNNDVLVVNNTWIFRFPRTATGAQSLIREATVLQRLHGHLPIVTPHPELHVPVDRHSEAFMVYRLIPGRSLTPPQVARMSTVRLKTIADQLANILDSLHSFALPQEWLDILEVEPVNAWSEMFARIQHHLFPRMRAEARNQVERNFIQFLDGSRSQTFPKALIHGDFGGSNILLAPDSPTVHAVIDWGSVAIGDPAVDYAAASTLDPRMMDLMSASHPFIAPLLDRVAFYRSTFALQEALFGAEHGDATALANGLRQYV